MKTSMYFNYVTRSLLRDGQRTLLAVFCVAVGVMSIVALQLVGSMLQNALTTSTRDTNGGDVALTAKSIPLQQNDLAFFDRLKSDGTITSYTAVTMVRGSLSPTASTFQLFDVGVVDPATYPVVSQPDFSAPGGATVAGLLNSNGVIVTQSFADNYHKSVGDSFDLYIKNDTGSGQTLHVTVAGVAANSGVFGRAGALVVISSRAYLAAAPGAARTYEIVDVATASPAQTDAAVKAIEQQFPLDITQTVADALASQQKSIDMITKFLEIAGLMALLIGGVGIVNTMQVLLSRRKTEIAMLKTTGYRRTDLYTLFGMEAGLIGLIGGVIGSAAATGVSYVVLLLMQNVGVTVPFSLNPWTIAGGLAIGLVTALIFGLMPIVQAANIRPLSVIRELPEGKGVGRRALSVGLLAVLSVLFCMLAIVILNGDVLLGIETVYGTFAALLVLSAFFGLVVFGLSKLPVPERFSFGYAALAAVGLALPVAAYLVSPLAGMLLFAAWLVLAATALMPRSWKVNAKLALRNIGRQRARTTTTMLALFIGVFSVGLVLALGADLQEQINNSFAQSLNFNLVAMTSGSDTAALQSKLDTLPGLSRSRQDTFTTVVPSAINGQPLQNALPAGHSRTESLDFLGSLEGYDLENSTPSVTIDQGRALTASDAGTDNIVISDLLTASGPFEMHLKPGDTITFAGAGGKTSVTATIVGVYARNSESGHVGSMLASRQMVSALTPAGAGAAMVTYMKIDPNRVADALNALGTIVPNARVQNMADVATYIEQMLNNILEMLVAIASLSLIAGVVIIANAVALAMLERRREMGILKSVGYTSGSVLSQIMIENGVIGAAGGSMAMLLAAGAVALLGSMLFNLALGMSATVALILVGAPALLAILTAGLVAWSAVRVRPLEVLRYE